MLPLHQPGTVRRSILHDQPRVLQAPASFPVPSAVRGRQVAVRAEHPQVLKPMIVFHAVDVVDVHRERFSQPFSKTAPAALVLDKPDPQESNFDVMPASAVLE